MEFTGERFLPEASGCIALEHEHRHLQAALSVRIYVAGAGNCFFQDIARLIKGGFTDIGVRAALVVAESFEDCAPASGSAADLHIIVAPHELFHFIPQAVNWPCGNGKKWVLNTEQAHTSWFAEAKASFAGADLILDMDHNLAATLSRNGFHAEHLPLGYSPSCRIFDGAAPIELNNDTNGIPRRIRDWADTGDVLDTPLHTRPLGYCFFGASTQRRATFFARNAAAFAKLEGYLRLKPPSGTLRVGKSIALSAEGASSIVRRSKVSLNIHQSDHRYFEWHRIVLQGIWQGALVLSEPCTAAWPFRPGIDYVAADLADLADLLEYVTLSDEGRAFAERIRRQGYATLTERCRMGDRLRELLRLYFGVPNETAGETA